MASGTVLPLRFGTQLAREEELVAAMITRRRELLAALERVRGHVEMGLRVILRAGRGGTSEARSGRAFLLERAAKHRSAEHAARELHDPLSRLATASVVSQNVAAPAILAASYLLDAGKVAEFRERAGELSAGLHDVQAVTTGPWPPYSFVEARERP